MGIKGIIAAARFVCSSVSSTIGWDMKYGGNEISVAIAVAVP